MVRPEVTLENFEQVYGFYREHEQNQVFARMAHFALAQRYRPDITVEPGAAEAITDELNNGSRIIVSPNHITADDQYVIVSMAQRLEILHRLRGNTFIPAEPSLFTRRGFSGQMLRRSVDGLGALPTFRLEDLRRHDAEVTDEKRELYERAMLMASDTQVSKIISGNHMAGFWEGTRNRQNHREVQSLKKGIGYTAIAASKEVKVLLLPVGMYYGGEPANYKKPEVPAKFIPTVHVGMPIPVTAQSAEELVDLLHPAIQACVDEAARVA